MAALPLSTAITNLRSELTLALEQGAQEKLLFDVGPIELELALELTAGAEVNAETKWVVFSAGAKATGERLSQHRLKLVLTPKLEGRNLKVASRRKVSDGSD